MTCRISLQKQTTLIVSAMILAAPASFADRKPAPIEYVGQGSVPRANSNATHDSWRGPVTKSGPGALPSSRVQLDFAYPGTNQPSPASERTQIASVEAAPKATAPRSAAAAWPDMSSPKPQAVAANSSPQTLVLGASPRNTASSTQRAEPVTPRFLEATAEERGLASWYGKEFHGNQTANGELFDMNAMTAAHRTLPLPSLVQVINEANGKEVVVRVNDRGPFEEGRIIDLSQKAAHALDIVSSGTAPVKVKYLGPAPEIDTSVAVAAAETEAPAPRIVMAEATPPAPRPDLYGDFLMGGAEPTLGVPDPGQTVATPARVERPANASPRPLVPADVQQASLPPVQTPAPASRPEPVRVAATPSSPASTPANAFGPKIYVQIGAFSDISNAEGMNAQVGRQYSVDIEPVRVQGADYFRVLVGPFSSRDAADLAKYQLGARGIKDGFIVLR